VEAYIASEIEDLLDKKAKTPPKQAAKDFIEEEGGSGPSPSTRSIVPSTLSQVLEVCTHVYMPGKVPNDESHARVRFRDAVRAVAKEKKLENQVCGINVVPTAGWAYRMCPLTPMFS